MVPADNSVEKVRARESILKAENRAVEAIQSGEIGSATELCKIRHYFTERSPEYGCHVYAREMSAPKGALIFGKIHRHEHLAFILKGKILVFTDEGNRYFQAGDTLISPPGVKRVGYVVEDTIWTTVHLTKHGDEGAMEAIEQEVIAPSFDDLGLIDSEQALGLEAGK